MKLCIPERMKIYVMATHMKSLLYLPVEIAARELDSKILIAYHAIHRGFGVVIGRTHSVKKAASMISTGIYLHKGHASIDFPQISGEHRAEILFCALDEEGLVFRDEAGFIDRVRPDKLTHMDFVFLWGTLQKKMILARAPWLEEKLFVTGNPRFDLLRPELRPFFNKSVRRIIKSYGQYFLINTNFSFANASVMYGTDLMEYTRNIYKRYRGRHLTEEEAVMYRDLMQFESQRFNQYCRMLKLLARKYPDFNFVLRPHPGENLTKWKQELSEYKNLQVVCHGSVANWIFGSLGVIHSDCTTGIESWAAGKPVIHYSPPVVQDMEMPLPSQFGEDVKDDEKLFSSIDSILKDTMVPTVREHTYAIKDLIFMEDNRLAAERLLDCFDGFVKEGRFSAPEVLDFENLRSKVSRVESNKAFILNNVLSRLFLMEPILSRFFPNLRITRMVANRQKFKSLSQRELLDAFSRLDAVFGYNLTNSLKCSRIASDTFLVFRNNHGGKDK